MSALNSASSASQVRSGARAARRLAAIAVMARQPLKPELQHHLGRARGPNALALDVGQALEETADIEQQTGKLRACRVERGMHTARAATMVSVKCAARPPACRPDCTVLSRLEVMRGIRCAQVKSVRSRSPACSWYASISAWPSRPRRR